MKKGITLIAISTIVLVLLILLSVVVINGKKSIETANKVGFLTEISDIQQRVLEYYKLNNELPILENIIINVSDLNADEKNEFEGETITNETVIFSKLNKTLIGVTDTKYGNNEDEKDIYAISEKTKRVYYIKGIKADNKNYFTYTNVKMNSVTVPREVKSNQTKVQDVIFEKSNENYTNIPIVTKVLLPLDANSITVTATNNKSISAISYEGFDKLVIVNEESADKTGNYGITVLYTVDGMQKTVTYNVENFDNTLPTANTMSRLLEDGRREIAVEANDDLSGIKTIKCEIGSNYTQDYFKSYGTVVKNGKCIIKDSDTYTIYVEDNASNYVLIDLEI